MEANYIRNYLNSYLVLPGDKNLKNYESKIIEENKIAGFLQVQTNCINQEFKYMYDISSKQSLKEVLEKKKFKKDDIIKLVNGILEVTQQIREYLLEINNIVLDPEYIYMDFSGKIEYCYYPYNNKDFFDELRKLFEHLLGNIEHNDKETVLLAYGIYQKILENKFELNMLNVEEEKPSKIEVDSYIEKQKEIITKENTSPDNKDKLLIVGFIVLAVIMLIVDRIPLIIRLSVISALIYFAYNKISREFQNKNKKADIAHVPIMENVNEFIEDIKEEPKEEIIYTQLLTKQNLEHPLLENIEGDIEDIELNNSTFIIGSMNDLCDYAIKDATVSRMHVKYEQREDRHYIKDMNSKNGTYVNEKLLAPNEVVEVFDGDIIVISKYKYCLHLA